MDKDRGWLDKERGKGMGKEAARKKSVCVMNYYPLIKVHVDFFRPFQPCCSSIFSNFFQFLLQMLRRIFLALKIQVEKYLNGKFIYKRL